MITIDEDKFPVIVASPLAKEVAAEINARLRYQYGELTEGTVASLIQHDIIDKIKDRLLGDLTMIEESIPRFAFLRRRRIREAKSLVCRYLPIAAWRKEREDDN